MTSLLTLLIGLFAGLRSLTPLATTAWAVRSGWLKLDGPLARFDWIGSTPISGAHPIVQAFGTPDSVVAVLEDLVAIAGSLSVVSRL